MRDQLRAAVPRLIAGHGADLSTLERFVLTKVDGRRSVTDVAGIVEISVDEALAIVLSLLERRAVRLEAGPNGAERRTTSGVRLRAQETPFEDQIVTLDDDDFEEVFDEVTLSDDPADAAVFSAPTVAGTMRALTIDEARDAIGLPPLPPPRVLPGLTGPTRR
jgi:hypothetical protein